MMEALATLTCLLLGPSSGISPSGIVTKYYKLSSKQWRTKWHNSDRTGGEEDVDLFRT